MAWSDDDAWSVRVTASAKRELDQLDDVVRSEAIEALVALEEDPFPAGSIELRGHPNWRRLKFYREAYRVVYTVSEKQRTVLVRRVRPRSTAYVGLS